MQNVLKRMKNQFSDFFSPKNPFFTLLEGDRHSINKKEERWEESERKMKGRSTQDINASVAQHIKGAFFFSRSLCEYDI